MTQPSISIEVMRDVRDPHIVRDETIGALSTVRSIVPNLEVLGVDSRLRVPADHDDLVHPEKIRIPSGADLLVVLTMSDLAISESVTAPVDRLGVALQGDPRRQQVAFVNTISKKGVYSTIVHEVGHLFSLKRRGERLSEEFSGHCGFAGCVMEAQLDREDPQKHYCSECSDHMQQVAYWRTKQKTGAVVDPRWT